MASDAQKISELLKVDEAQYNAASEHKETTPATRYTKPQPSPLLTKEIQPAGQDRQLTTTERLNKIAESKAESRDEVKKIQTEINTIIDSMAKNSSLLSRASNTWGELGFIEKTLTGSFIIVPLIPAAILGNVVTLLVLGGFAVISAESLYV